VFYILPIIPYENEFRFSLIRCVASFDLCLLLVEGLEGINEEAAAVLEHPQGVLYYAELGCARRPEYVHDGIPLSRNKAHETLVHRRWPEGHFPIGLFEALVNEFRRQLIDPSVPANPRLALKVRVDAHPPALDLSYYHHPALGACVQGRKAGEDLLL